MDELMNDFMTMNSIYSIIQFNSDKFLNFMSKSFMHHIDDTNETTTDLYILLSRILGSYKMFIHKVFNYPCKKQCRLMNDPFQINLEKLKEKETFEKSEEQPLIELCVVKMCEPEPPKQFDNITEQIERFNYLMEIESQYGLIDDVLICLMNKLFSYKFKTVINNKINNELLSDLKFCDNIYKLAMYVPILLNTIKVFMN